MYQQNRRHFLQQGTRWAAAWSLLTAQARSVLASPPPGPSHSLQDVAHIVVLTQENRSFDHYFGTLCGVRGFRDPFCLPVSAHGTVWQQPRVHEGREGTRTVQPFHLDTRRDFRLMRAQGTAHSWPDAQAAWDHGRLSNWTLAKGEHSMGHYRRADLPLLFALADAFTVCDAYHCSFQGGTNTNRLFLWTGTNDPLAQGQGPATYNDLESLKEIPGKQAYTWTTYPERLQAAGVHWQIYQDMADNYDDNPLAGFDIFRRAHANAAGLQELKDRALSTRKLEQLRLDVLEDRLPQVCWIVAEARNSEHPDRSSPAQGADYTARVIEALTANPKVWARTVLFLNFDENDGYFDHMPPPAPPSYVHWDADPVRCRLAGASTVSTKGEYHEHLVSYHDDERERALLHRPYGLGPRVPMLVISPWSRGGWVNSEVFDHTSVIRFMEQRFGVLEPNISPWRRAVCGDLTSAFDFTGSDPKPWHSVTGTRESASRAQQLSTTVLAQAPSLPQPLWQESGSRPARALPYQLQVHSRIDPAASVLTLEFVNAGRVGAVFHVYDLLNLQAIPRRYTIESDKQLIDSWRGEPGTGYDLWLLGPNGFHRRLSGRLPTREDATEALVDVAIGYHPEQSALSLRMSNPGPLPCQFTVRSNLAGSPWRMVRDVAAGASFVQRVDLRRAQGWYDLSVKTTGQSGFLRRFAGRLEAT